MYQIRKPRCTRPILPSLYLSRQEESAQAALRLRKGKASLGGLYKNIHQRDRRGAHCLPLLCPGKWTLARQCAGCLPFILS